MNQVPRLPLRDAIAVPQTKRDYTRWVFSTIADRYDAVNVVLSFNRDRAWKRRLASRANLRPHEVALDAACGTGDIAFALAPAGGRVVALDITPRMIDLAKSRAARSAVHVQFTIGDMTALPFDGATFDLVTTGYGIRNVPDIGAALLEVRRVLKPGGRFFSLDFNRPENSVVRGAYLAYLRVVGGVIGWIVHRRADTYRYIPETIRHHPGAAELVGLLERAGFAQAAYEPVFGGFMALHSATRAN